MSYACVGPLILFILAVALTWYIWSSDGTSFKQETPCLCRYGDGKYVNLTDLVPIHSDEKFLTVNMGNSTLYYHGCTDVEFGVKIDDVITNTCTEPLSLCLYNRTDHSLSKMGRAVDSNFRKSRENHKLLQLAYEDKDSSRTTLITLVCTENSQKNVFYVDSYNETLYELHLLTSYACKLEAASIITFGIILGIIFLILISLLLCCVCLMRCC